MQHQQEQVATSHCPLLSHHLTLINFISALCQPTTTILYAKRSTSSSKYARLLKESNFFDLFKSHLISVSDRRERDSTLVSEVVPVPPDLLEWVSGSKVQSMFLKVELPFFSVDNVVR
jgi:hypothetical protein